jgi:hypothetical protein
MQRTESIGDETHLGVDRLAAGPFDMADGQRLHDGDEALVRRDQVLVSTHLPLALGELEQLAEEGALRPLSAVLRKLTTFHLVFTFHCTLLSHFHSPFPFYSLLFYLSLTSILFPDMGCRSSAVIQTRLLSPPAYEPVRGRAPHRSAARDGAA